MQSANGASPQIFPGITVPLSLVSLPGLPIPLPSSLKNAISIEWVVDYTNSTMKPPQFTNGKHSKDLSLIFPAIPSATNPPSSQPINVTALVRVLNSTAIPISLPMELITINQIVSHLQVRNNLRECSNVVIAIYSIIICDARCTNSSIINTDPKCLASSRAIRSAY